MTSTAFLATDESPSVPGEDDMDDVLVELNHRIEDLLSSYLDPGTGIRFDLPDEAPTSPTISVFLYDVQEDLQLRHGESRAFVAQANGFAPGRVHLRCCYMITYWDSTARILDADSPGARAASPTVRALSRVLNALLNNRDLPGMPGTYTRVIPPAEQLNSLTNFWQSIGNKPRLSLSYAVTVPIKLLSQAAREARQYRIENVAAEVVPLQATAQAALHLHEEQLRQQLHTDAARFDQMVTDRARSLLEIKQFAARIQAVASAPANAAPSNTKIAGWQAIQDSAGKLLDGAEAYLNDYLMLADSISSATFSESLIRKFVQRFGASVEKIRMLTENNPASGSIVVAQDGPLIGELSELRKMLSELQHLLTCAITQIGYYDSQVTPLYHVLRDTAQNKIASFYNEFFSQDGVHEKINIQKLLQSSISLTQACEDFLDRQDRFFKNMMPLHFNSCILRYKETTADIQSRTVQLQEHLADCLRASYTQLAEKKETPIAAASMVKSVTQLHELTLLVREVGAASFSFALRKYTDLINLLDDFLQSGYLASLSGSQKARRKQLTILSAQPTADRDDLASRFDALIALFPISKEQSDELARLPPLPSPPPVKSGDVQNFSSVKLHCSWLDESSHLAGKRRLKVTIDTAVEPIVPDKLRILLFTHLPLLRSWQMDASATTAVVNGIPLIISVVEVDGISVPLPDAPAPAGLRTVVASHPPSA